MKINDLELLQIISKEEETKTKGGRMVSLGSKKCEDPPSLKVSKDDDYGTTCTLKNPAPIRIET